MHLFEIQLCNSLCRSILRCEGHETKTLTLNNVTFVRRKDSTRQNSTPRVFDEKKSRRVENAQDDGRALAHVQNARGAGRARPHVENAPADDRANLRTLSAGAPSPVILFFKMIHYCLEREFDTPDLGPLVVKLVPGYLSVRLFAKNMLKICVISEKILRTIFFEKSFCAKIFFNFFLVGGGRVGGIF